MAQLPVPVGMPWVPCAQCGHPIPAKRAELVSPDCVECAAGFRALRASTPEPETVVWSRGGRL